MEPGTDTVGKARGRGRKDSTGTPAKITTKPIKDAMKELAVLQTKMQNARDKYNDGVVAVAEKAGIKSNVLKKWLKAAASDKVEEAKAEIEQMDILFSDLDAADLKAA